MNYKKHYDLLIERAKNRSILLGEYYENHHIVPKCMGGSNEYKNLVKLFADEHYLAHLLLVKLYPENIKLIFAANMMCLLNDVERINNKRYEWLRKKHAIAMSKLHSGKTISNEMRIKISKTKKGRRVSEEHKKKISASLIGRKKKPFSLEHKRKISLANTGKIGVKQTDENKKKISERHKGKIITPEHRLKISQAAERKRLGSQKVLS